MLFEPLVMSQLLASSRESIPRERAQEEAEKQEVTVPFMTESVIAHHHVSHTLLVTRPALRQCERGTLMEDFIRR